MRASILTRSGRKGLGLRRIEKGFENDAPLLLRPHHAAMTDCDTLDEYKKRIDERFLSLEKLAQRERELLHVAVVQAKEAIDYRLSGMNDLRRQIESERGRYALQLAYDLHCSDDDKKHDSITQMIHKLDNRVYGLETRIWIGGATVTAFLLAAQLLIHWLKSP